MSLLSTFQAAKLGDEESILILYNKFLPKIKKCSRNLNYETAETDITIRFLEFIKNLKIDYLKSTCDGAIVNYINKFFINTYLNLLNAKKHQIHQVIYLDDENSFTKDIPYYDENNIYEDIYLSKLTVLQRRVIVLKFIYGFSDQEIGNILKISRQAVNRAKNRGIKTIKSIYDETKKHMEVIMEERLVEIAATQGIWALLSIALIFYIIKTQEKRDLRQEERENNYQGIIAALTDKLNTVEEIKDDVAQIKDLLKN